MSGNFAVLPAQQANPANAERRVLLRYACELEGSCRPSVVADGIWPAKAQNICAKGINLLLSRRFEPGTILAVEIGSSADFCMLLARVVWSAPRPAGGWLIGCALSRELNNEDLKALRQM